MNGHNGRRVVVAVGVVGLVVALLLLLPTRRNVTGRIRYELVNYTSVVNSKQTHCSTGYYHDILVTFDADETSAIRQQMCEPPGIGLRQAIEQAKEGYPVFREAVSRGGCLSPLWSPSYPANRTVYSWYEANAIPHPAPRIATAGGRSFYSPRVWVLEAVVEPRAVFVTSIVRPIEASTKNPKHPAWKGGGLDITVANFNRQQVIASEHLQKYFPSSDEGGGQGQPLPVAEVAPGLVDCRVVGELVPTGTVKTALPTLASSSRLGVAPPNCQSVGLIPNAPGPDSVGMNSTAPVRYAWGTGGRLFLCTTVFNEDTGNPSECNLPGGPYAACYPSSYVMSCVVSIRQLSARSPLVAKAVFHDVGGGSIPPNTAFAYRLEFLRSAVQRYGVSLRALILDAQC